MMVYWCKFFDTRGRVAGAERMEAPDDAQVIVKARLIYTQSFGSGCEIWDGKRLVHRERAVLPHEGHSDSGASPRGARANQSQTFADLDVRGCGFVPAL